MYQLTGRMEQALRQNLVKYHDLFDGGRCSGWELEELVFKSIQSDSTAGHHATWNEGGHDDEADIRVRVNGEIYPLQIKSGEIKQVKTGSSKTPHLVLSGHWLSRFNGNFVEMTEYLNQDRANFPFIPYRKVDDDKGRHHIYQIVYVEGMYLRKLKHTHWDQASKSSWRQINTPHGVIFTLHPKMSWQIWLRIPLSLTNHSQEFVLG